LSEKAKVREKCVYSVYHEDIQQYYCCQFNIWNPNCSKFCPAFTERGKNEEASE